MGFMDIFKKTDMEGGLASCQATPGAVLLDVRTTCEYEEGRIPGSENLPLMQLKQIESRHPDKATPLFVYCLSGARSTQAVAELKRLGYEQVTNLGGITDYKGKVEKDS